MARLKLKPIIPLEKDVQASIIETIIKLKLGTVHRINSGAVQMAGRYVRFNSAEAHSDLSGVLRPDGRAFFLEVKRPGWKEPINARERKQNAFLIAQRAAGAIAEFVTSADEALALLGRWQPKTTKAINAS